jgi:pimeloyl-ACP methyl ester carboxylesterase
MEKKCIKSEHGTIWYWIYRSNNPNAKWIVFTHGLVADHTIFDRQVEHFTKAYSVITWDLPLHGESTPYKHFTYANAARELNAILETEKITRTVLVGMSLGGIVCQPFIETYPEKAQAFIALGTTPFGLQYYSRSDLFFLRHSGAMFACFPEKMLHSVSAKWNSMSEEGRSVMRKMLAPLSKKEICYLMGTAYSAFVAENHDIELACPVLIIFGANDRTGKVKQYNMAWADKPGYPIVIIPNAAHLCNVDNWQEVNQAIEEFISQQHCE